LGVPTILTVKRKLMLGVTDAGSSFPGTVSSVSAETSLADLGVKM
jgi:hypothetical protein